MILQQLLLAICISGALSIPEADLGVGIIPLDQVWGFGMGKTKDIHKLDPRTQTRKDTLVWKLNEILTLRSSTGKKAGPCFVVTGEGKQALTSVAKIMGGEKKIPEILPSNEPLTLFFFSQLAPGYVTIDSIETGDAEITVNYQIVTHVSADASTHFALIPLGQLPIGKLKVNIREIIPPKPYKNKSLADRAACDSNSFIVRKGKEP